MRHSAPIAKPSRCPGTDVLGMTTRAVPSLDGSSYKIDGAKMWITNGTTDGRTTGDVFLVYARTGPGRQDVSMFLVEKARGSAYGQERTVYIMICYIEYYMAERTIHFSHRDNLSTIYMVM